MESNKKTSEKREVSYFGPIFIGNSNSKLPHTGDKQQLGKENGTALKTDEAQPTESLDLSKYKFIGTTTCENHHREIEGNASNLFKPSEYVLKSVPSHNNTYQTNNGTKYSPKCTNEEQDYTTSNNVQNGNPSKHEVEQSDTVKDTDDALDTLDKAINNDKFNVVADCPFKISSSEDNYIMNKYKAKTNKTDLEPKQDYFESNVVNLSDATHANNRSFPKVQQTSFKQNNCSKTDLIIKNRSKIARLKQKFFESSHKQRALKPKDLPKPIRDTDECKQFETNNANTCNTDDQVQNTNDPSSETLQDSGQPAKPPRVYTPRDHYATESRATMQRNLKSQNTERHRRHSSEGHLRVVNTFDTIHRRWDASDLTNHLDNFMAVVAIDFGTTYSGYAYSFTQDPDVVYLMRRQEGGDPGVYNQKTPTTILLTPEGAFHSFGYAARDAYHDLDLKDAQKWMYFDRFKMLLHKDEVIGKDSVLHSISGHEMSAMTIFSYSLAYFKDLALAELSDQSCFRVTSDVIRWIITVPAIWKASAKQFMRHAAYEAGIIPKNRPEQLLIALEPEAASIYCRRLRMFQMVSSDTPRASITDITRASSLSLPELNSNDVSIISNDLEIGTRYMVVDCGGGTVDITVHEILTGGRLKELHRASGGAHGSVGVDEEFERLLAGIFGHDIIQQFKNKRPSGWVDLMVMFESRKRTASPYRSCTIAISFPFSFIDFYKKSKGTSAENAVKKFGDPDITWSSGGMLKLAPGAMRRLFLPTVDRIKQAIGAVLNNSNTRDLSYMFLVGGFAESSVVQHELRKDFSCILKVIIPPGVGMTILKGAVYFGLDPHIIHERCSCYTYGVGVLHRFNPQNHPKVKLVTNDGIDWCTDILDAFVHVNQSIAMGDSIVRRYTPVNREQTTTTIHIYSTEKADATFITESGVVKCGSLNLNVSADEIDTTVNERREIRTEMKFGDTEIKVTATDIKTGKFVEAFIDFMNT